MASGGRGQSAVVGKALETAILVLYIGLVTTALFGGAVPGYTSAAADELADRTLAAAALQIHQTLPPAGQAIDARRRVDLPTTIDGASYAILVEDRSLTLVHPRPSVGGRLPLALPGRVATVEGRWTSGGASIVQVTGDTDAIRIRLTEEENT